MIQEKIGEDYFPDLFDLIVGADLENPLTKAKMLIKYINKLQIKNGIYIKNSTIVYKTIRYSM